MKFLFKKPEMSVNESVDTNTVASRAAIDQCDRIIYQLCAYLNGLRVLLACSILLTVIAGLLFGWIGFLAGLPLVRYWFKKFNVAKFELKIHLFMRKFTYEMYLESITGVPGTFMKNIIES
jgi:hypothetical protein